MRIIYILSFSFIISSCSFKHQIVYLGDANKKLADSWTGFSATSNSIETADILGIDILTTVPEASQPYNRMTQKTINNQNVELLKLDGYTVDDSGEINFPVIGKVSVSGLNENEIEIKITKLLTDGNHLTNPTVKVRRLNSKFTVLGEVKNPGTFSYYEQNINILQALGYAGDLTIDGNRDDITIVRKVKGSILTYKIELTKSNFLESPLYNIKNNDVIIVNPNYNKIKSAGFIGNPSSIASIASLLLSITLLITNN